MKKKNNSISVISMMTVIFLAVVCFIFGITNIEKGQADKGKEELELSLRRAVAAYYAAEGVYPPDIDHLTDIYGIRIDENRFAVKYNAFASNLMPDITVLDVGYER